MSLNDRIALELGRAHFRAIILEAQLEAAQQRVVELEQPPKPEPPAGRPARRRSS